MTAAMLVFSIVSSPSMLFVGNSYSFGNGGLWSSVKQIYESLESDTLEVDHSASGGASFQEHWNNQQLHDMIESGDWDQVVFQEQSCMPVINPSQTYLYGDSLAWLVKQYGGEPVFLMTWARKNDPLMLEGLELGYSRMGFAHNTPVAPCGRAFDLIRREHPEIDLYTGDGSHPSVHGTYLAACVILLASFETDILTGTVWQPAGISFAEGNTLRLAATVSYSTYSQPGERK